MTNTKETQMPLNDCQMGVFLESLSEPQSLKYNLPISYKFNKSEIEFEKLVNAIKEAVKAFSDFSIRISSDKDGNYSMHYDNSFEPVIEIEESKETDIERICKDFIKPFQLIGEKLYRLKIVKTETHIYFLYDAHHVLMDGIGQSVFEKAIKDAYEGKEIEKQNIDATGLCRLIHEEAKKDNFKEDYDFFEKYIGGIDVDSNLPVDKPDEADINSDSSNQFHFTISTKLSEIDSFTKTNHIRRSAFFQAVYAYALAKFTCQNEILFCTALNKRNSNKDLQNSIGMMVRNLPFYTKIDEQLTSIEFIKNVQENISNLEQHENASFVELTQRHGLRSAVSFVYSGKILDSMELSDAKGNRKQINVGSLMSNLKTVVCQHSNNYEICFDYKNKL